MAVLKGPPAVSGPAFERHLRRRAVELQRQRSPPLELHRPDRVAVVEGEDAVDARDADRRLWRLRVGLRPRAEPDRVDAARPRSAGNRDRAAEASGADDAELIAVAVRIEPARTAARHRAHAKHERRTLELRARFDEHEPPRIRNLPRSRHGAVVDLGFARHLLTGDAVAP